MVINFSLNSKRAAYSIRITYTIILNTLDPKCTGNWIWICSCKKAWWWLCRAETCRLECVFNNKLDVFGWKKICVLYRKKIDQDKKRQTNPMKTKQASSGLYPLVIDDKFWTLTLFKAHLVFRTLKLKVPFIVPPYCSYSSCKAFNPLNPELSPICYLLALLAHHFLHVSRIRVQLLTFRRQMSYIYGAPILDVSRSHTTTQHSR